MLYFLSKSPACLSTGQWQHLSFILLLLSLQATVVIDRNHRILSSSSSFPSVEALTSALVPLAVDHKANDDEENEAQQRKEDGKKEAYSAHPFFTLTSWTKVEMERIDKQEEEKQ